MGEEGWEVGGHVDQYGEGDEEGPAEEEHLVAAEVEAREGHGDEEDDAGRKDAEMDRGRRRDHRGIGGAGANVRGVRLESASPMGMGQRTGRVLWGGSESGVLSN